MSCQVRVPRGTRNPGSIRDLLGRIGERMVESPCGDALSSVDLGEEVVRINRLGVQLLVNLQATSESDVGRRWGRALAVSIKDALARDSLKNVRRFSSPREFVTLFLRDLLDGTAWDRWYYDEFRPLRSLSSQEVAVQMLQARPEWVLPVFAHLRPSGHAERLIDRMTLQDLRRLWNALELNWDAAPHFSPAELHSVTGLAALWPKAPLNRGFDRESRAKDHFRLSLMAAAPTESVRLEAPLTNAVKAMVDVAAVIRLNPGLGPVLSMGSGLYPSVERQLSGGPLADAVPWLVQASSTAEGRNFLARIAEAVGDFAVSAFPHTVADSTGQRLIPPASADADSKETVEEQPPRPSFETGEEQLQLGSGESAQPPDHGQYREDDRPAGSSSVVFPGSSASKRPVIPAKEHPALNSPIGSVFLVCPALAELGLWELWTSEVGEATARLYVFAAALKVLGRANALRSRHDAALTIFAGIEDTRELSNDAESPANTIAAWPAKVPQIASRWYPAHQRDLVRFSTGGSDILRDAAAGHWIEARPSNSGDAQMLTGLQVVEAGVRTVPWAQESQDFANEAAHFQLGGDLGYPWLTPSLDAELSVVASLALRRTAEQLPGFGRSSPAYLARQFLAQPATLILDSDGLTVHLGGGPLGVVLRLASLPTDIEIPWLAYPLSLTAPDGYGPLA